MICRLCKCFNAVDNCCTLPKPVRFTYEIPRVVKADFECTKVEVVKPIASPKAMSTVHPHYKRGRVTNEKEVKAFETYLAYKNS